MVEKLKDAKPYLSPAQVAERYDVALVTVYNWDRHGFMPESVKLRRKRLWWLAVLEEWEDAGFPQRTLETKTEEVQV